MVADSVTDVVYLVQVESGTYVDGNALNTGWLIAYAAFALLGDHASSSTRDGNKVAPQRWTNLRDALYRGSFASGFQLASISRAARARSVIG